VINTIKQSNIERVITNLCAWSAPQKYNFSRSISSSQLVACKWTRLMQVLQEE